MRVAVPVILLMLGCLLAPQAHAAERVGGYIRKDGTYVAPYSRTSPDSSRLNNYSTKPNINPSTGKRGTSDSFKALPAAASRKKKTSYGY